MKTNNRAQRIKSITILAMGGVVISGAATAAVTSLDVINHSFESPSGNFNSGAIDGWAKGGGLTSSGNFNPTTFLPGGFYADTPGGMNGDRSAFMLRGSTTPTGYFEQTLLGSDATVGGGDDPVLAANATYTVTVAIGRRDGSRADSDGPEDFAGFNIELFAGTNVAGSATHAAGSFLPGSVAGDFMDFSFDFSTGVAPTGLGEALKIRIGRHTGGDPRYLDFDNVRITSQPVPEPASLALLGLGSLAVMFRRRK